MYAQSQPGNTRTVLAISGMKDNASRELVVEALEGVGGVREVRVRLLRAAATIWHDAGSPAAELIRAVEGAGFGASPAPGSAAF